MKKVLSILLVLIVLLCVMCGCFVGDTEQLEKKQETIQTKEDMQEETIIPDDETLKIEKADDTLAGEVNDTGHSAEENSGDEPVLPEESTFEVYYLDVGQGDCSLILCDDHAMMIDGGSSSNSSTVYSFLQEHAIDHLDAVVATHPDEDHIGGLSGALNYATADTAYCTVTAHDSEAFGDLTKYLKAQGIEITVPDVGDQFFLGSAVVTVLHPPKDNNYSDNTSIVLRIDYGDTFFLFTGDAEAADEEVMLKSGLVDECTVLKVAHHGSSSSTSGIFLSAAAPQYAVISVGGDNTYGHPTEDVLGRLRDNDTILFRTDIYGTIHVVSNGKTVEFDVEHPADVDPFQIVGGYGNYLIQQAEIERAAAEQPEAEEPKAEAESEILYDYVVNTNTGKFHRTTCSSVDQMKDSNRWDYTGTRDDLIAMGYQPCKRCNP